MCLGVAWTAMNCRLSIWPDFFGFHARLNILWFHWILFVRQVSTSNINVFVSRYPLVSLKTCICLTVYIPLELCSYSTPAQLAHKLRSTIQNGVENIIFLIPRMVTVWALRVTSRSLVLSTKPAKTWVVCRHNIISIATITICNIGERQNSMYILHVRKWTRNMAPITKIGDKKHLEDITCM